MSETSHRRDFVKAVTLGAIAAPVAAHADEPRPAPPEPSEADARMALILARFGHQLDDNARKIVRGEVESLVQRAEALRKFALENGDAPFPVFHPYRAPLES